MRDSLPHRARSAGTAALFAGLAIALLAMVACEEYLAGPGEEGVAEPPVLTGVALDPDSVNIVVAPAMVDAIISVRSRAGMDSVRVVLRSPSGGDRLRCAISTPATGDVFDGEWVCTLNLVQGLESGEWTPDSITLFAPEAGGGEHVFTGATLDAADIVAAVDVVGEPPVATELTVAPDSATLPDADSEVLLVATILDQYGRPMADAPVTWASEDAAVAVVDSAGRVTPAGVGSTGIVAVSGPLADTASIQIPSTPTTLPVEPPSLTLDSAGVTAQLAAAVLNQFGDSITDAVIDWSSGDETVVTVSPDGLVTAVGPGITTAAAESGDLLTTVPVTVNGGPQPPGFRWINTAGGRFHDAANWNRNAVPGVADTAWVDLDGSYEVTIDDTGTVAVLNVGNQAGRIGVRVDGGALVVADTAHFGPRSRLELLGGLAGDGGVTVDDSLVWSSGLLSGAGGTTVTAGGTLVMDSDGTKESDARDLTLTGTGSWSQGRVNLGNGATLRVAAGATLTMTAADTLAWTPGPVGRGFLAVDGTLVRAGTAGTSTITAGLVNNGLVRVEPTGTMNLGGSGGLEGAGDWQVQVDGILEIGGNSATMQFETGGTVTGAGRIRVLTSVVDMAATVNMDGTIEVVGNTFAVRSPDTARVNGLEMRGGPVSFASGSVLRVRDTFLWESGVLFGEGALHLPQGTTGSLETTGTHQVDSRSQLVVGGLLDWSAGGLILSNGGDLIVESTGEVQLRMLGTLRAQNSLSPDQYPTFVNDGLVVADPGVVGTLAVEPTFTNRGTLQMSRGTTAFVDTFTQEAIGVLSGGGVLDLSGATSVTIAGSVEPGTESTPIGTLTVQGELLIDTGTTVRIGVGGPAGGESDVLDVSGVLGSYGKLEITGIGDFVPAAGDTIEIARYGSRVGTFGEVTGLDFGEAQGGAPLDTVYEANRLLLVGEETAAPALTGVLVFASDRDGSRDLYLKDLETGVVTQVTNDFRVSSSPAFSPDGSRIAYADNADEILIVDVDGASEISLTGPSSSPSAAAPTWSPDGTTIAYQGVDTDYEIVTVPVADTASRTFLTANTFQDRHPDWSPDGSRIVFTEDDGSRERVVTIRASDGGDRQVHTNGTARSPVWSPDGTEIAYSEATVDGWEIRVVEVATNAQRVVVSDGTYNWFPTWSPDGQYILYAKNPDFTNDEFDLWAIRSDGSGSQVLVEGAVGNEYGSDWATGITVPNGVPTASISAPADGSVFSPGTAITLEGSATDPEDGALTGASLAWTSDLDGPIGTGESLTVNSLSRGTHTISLTATDSEGATGSDEITVVVNDQADLSVAMTVSPDTLQVGDTLTHTVTVTNAGPDPVDGVELRVLVEGDLLFTAPGQEGCGDFTSADPPSKLWICALGSLGPGGAVNLTLRILPQAAETVYSTAQISDFINADDPVLTNNVATDSAVVTAGVPSLTGVLAFASERDGTRDIYLKDLETGAMLQVTDEARTNNSPRLSPDRTRVVFSNFQFNDNQPIAIVNADGTGNETIVSTTYLGLYPSWAPDGNLLYFTDQISGLLNIWVADPANPTDRTRITDAATSDENTYGPRISPDGQRLVYAENERTIVSIRASDGGDRQILYDQPHGPTGSLINRTPAWSPDGTEVAFDNGGYDILIVNVNTLQVRRVVDGQSTVINTIPTWSPDGQYIAFSRNSEGGLAYEIWAVRADGTGVPFLVEDSTGLDTPGHWVDSVPFPIP